MRMIQLILATFSVLAFAGCKTVDIKDGQVPSKYLSQAKKLAGTYKGDFQGTPGNLIISFNGNKPQISYVNKRGTDILNNNCRSEFGDLLNVTIKNENKSPTVSAATFDFDAGNCSLLVRGRDAILDFKETDRGTRIRISILRDVYDRQVCDIWPGNPHQGNPPSQHCRWEQTAVYMYGTFYK